ncbi:hypothetical protein JYU08_00615 [bacterium AH-315-B06]|nr:hypothetical protein [bacterium AH-315-B06]
MDEETINQSHEIIIVAAELDSSSERIVAYLNEYDIPINVITFQFFKSGDQLLLSRAWLIDPIETQVKASSRSERATEEWNSEFYVSYGVFSDRVRSWDDAIEFGFVSAGGRKWYSRTLGLLSEGDRIWIKAPQHGFVGVGEVLGPFVKASEFTVEKGGIQVPVMEAAKRGSYHSEFINDDEKCEHFVPVKWHHTVSLDNAISEVGLFGNRNTVCKPKTPKWRHTVERLKQYFDVA